MGVRGAPPIRRAGALTSVASVVARQEPRIAALSTRLMSAPDLAPFAGDLMCEGSYLDARRFRSQGGLEAVPSVGAPGSRHGRWQTGRPVALDIRRYASLRAILVR
jgi:hypothetical protein